MTTAGDHAAPGAAIGWALRVVVLAALAVDAVVHLRLAEIFDYEDAGIGSGNMFRIASAAAILSGLYLLVRADRAAYGTAFLVLFSACVAVVLYRYVDVPQLGPIPPMYEPVWYAQKTLSAGAEGVGALAAAVGVVVTGRRPRPAGTP